MKDKLVYNALIICSISKSDAYIIDIFENSFSNQGFEYTTIGKNPYIEIDLKYIQEIISSFDVIFIVITNPKYLNYIKSILDDNIIILNLKKRPVIVLSTQEIVEVLKEKSTFSFIINQLHMYQINEIQTQITKVTEKIKDIVDKRKFSEDIGTLGLILGGIGIGVGLLFYLFKDKGEDDE